MSRKYTARGKKSDYPPNLILIIDTYERVVQDLLGQVRRQSDFILDLTKERMRLLDLIGASSRNEKIEEEVIREVRIVIPKILTRGVAIICEVCKGTSIAGKANTRWCKRCAKIRKKEWDHDNWISEGKAKRAAKKALKKAELKEAL